MQRNALLLLRTLALAGLAVSLWALLASLAQTADSFNPAYAGHYFRQQLLRPTLGMGLSLLGLLLARPLARWLARDLDS